MSKRSRWGEGREIPHWTQSLSAWIRLYLKSTLFQTQELIQPVKSV